MRVIKSYSVGTVGYTDVLMPVGAKILSFEVSGEGEFPVLSAIVDESNESEIRRFLLLVEGLDILDSEQLDYVDTIKLNNDYTRLHCFEVTGNPSDWR